MTTSLTAEVALIVDEPAELVFSVAAAAGPEIIDERLECTSDGTPLAIEEFPGPVGAPPRRTRSCRAADLLVRDEAERHRAGPRSEHR